MTKLVNANTEKVFFYIDKLLSDNGGRYCVCHRCRIDAAALALNTLPPHYFVDPGNYKTMDLGSPWILIEVAVREAMEKVTLFPHHLPDDLKADKSNASALQDRTIIEG